MDIIGGWFISWFTPILLGTGAWWLSNRVTGRNGQKALRFGALGFWTLLLFHLWPVFGLMGPLGWLLMAVSVLLPVGFFGAAANSLLREVRAQQRGEHTERAV